MLIYQLAGTFDTREPHLDVLWEYGATGLEERDGHIRVYFDERTELPAEVADGLWLEEPEQDWQAEFKKGLHPVQAGNVHIIAPWHERPSSGHVLVIEPKMAFGTGHHATTRMAVEALQDHPLQGLRVLDVGTGSGVLALVAHLLGAAFAYGIDIDPITIPIARENAEVNGLGSSNLQFDEGSLSSTPAQSPLAPLHEPFDVLVANIYAEIHDILMEQYAQHLSAQGRVILTGILGSKAHIVQAALERVGFGNVQQRSDGEWVLMTAERVG